MQSDLPAVVYPFPLQVRPQDIRLWLPLFKRKKLANLIPNRL